MTQTIIPYKTNQTNCRQAVNFGFFGIEFVPGSGSEPYANWSSYSVKYVTNSEGFASFMRAILSSFDWITVIILTIQSDKL